MFTINIKKTLFAFTLLGCMLCMAPYVHAQNDSIPAEEEETELSTGKVPFLRSLSIYADLGKPAASWLDTESKLEGGIQVSLGNGIVAEAAYGQAELRPEQVVENGSYYADGSYLRFGAGYQWIIKETNLIQLMANYGMSTFDDGGSVLIVSEVWDDYTASYSRNDLSATWAEIAMLTETQVIRSVYAGMALRLRYLIDTDDFEGFPVRAIPGYGFAFNTTTPALNIYIRFRLPE
ncbi:DUF6048 family protein [Roseivirga sp. BDSF3-8]|uniref:DUF6048 family protein n=1 Tax=Roseivirga sp. BDSF3-8 TaxID=3241598 RepID=UPI003531D1DD